MTDDNSKSWLSCLGWGCLTVVVLAVLGIGGCVGYLYQQGSGARSTTDAYLENLDLGRFEEAYGQLGSEFTDEHGLSEFIAFEQAAQQRYGDCGERRLSGTNMNREPGRAVTVLTYYAECDGAPLEVVFTLERVEGEWVIQGVRYHEPEMMVPVICDGCGTVHPPGAKFCSNCGAALGGDEEPAEAPGAEVLE
jgi:hypothetical protein